MKNINTLVEDSITIAPYKRGILFFFFFLYENVLGTYKKSLIKELVYLQYTF